MIQSFSLPSPAKLNLFLHINGQREDGYHLLQTVFQLLDYGDMLHFSPADQLQLHTTIPELNSANNLILKAARALQTATGCRLGATIHLDKKLPMGGGVGGGSSNAATALLGLNHLWQTHLSLAQLAEIGLTLGADVPIFIHGQSAWAEGVGELISPLELPEKWFVVIRPDEHVATANVFREKNLTRNTPIITVSAFLEGGGKNDCQNVVLKRYPKVKEAVDWLNNFAFAKLTGTGSCIFASFPSQQEAEGVFANRPEHLKGFVAKGVNRSPLHFALQTIS